MQLSLTPKLLNPNLSPQEPLPKRQNLTALTRALTLAANKRANIHTDSKCTFHIIHSHAASGRNGGSYLLHGTGLSSSPFQLMYGHPFLLGQFPTASPLLGDYLPTLNLISHLMREQADHFLPKPHQTKSADLTLIAGDRVLLKAIHHKDLQSRWTGPFEVILTTPTAAKLAGHSSWFHISRLKWAPGDSPSLPRNIPRLGTPRYAGTVLGSTRLRLDRIPEETEQPKTNTDK